MKLATHRNFHNYRQKLKTQSILTSAFSLSVPMLSHLQALLPPGELSLSPSVLAEHAGDKWFASHQPDAVALPRSTKSVSALLRFANRHRLPVTARGAGHGYVGGCVPVRGG